MNIVEMAELELTFQRMLVSSKTSNPRGNNMNDTFDQRVDQHEKKLYQIRGSLINEDYEKVVQDFLSCANMAFKDLRLLVDNVLSEGPLERHLELISVGISALQLFVGANWTGRGINESTRIQKVLNEFTDVNTKSLNKIFAENVSGESVEPVCKDLEVLYLAYLCLFGHTIKNSFNDNWATQWWQLRFLCVNQQIITEKSDAIYQKTLKLISILEKNLQETQKTGMNENENDAKRTYHIFFNLEVSAFYATYFDIANMTKYAEKATEITGIQINETGILGKRTKFQQKNLPQFTLNLMKNHESDKESLTESKENDDGSLDSNKMHFPKDMKLDDEVRLDKIQFVDERECPTLSKNEQCLVFAIYNIVKKSTPKDELANEQLIPYLETILNGKIENQIWALRTNALLERSKLERDNRRTIERSLMQIETLVDSIRQSSDSDGYVSKLRMDHLYITKLPPSWHLEMELVRLYQSMGSVKSALDIALKLQQWEDVISCYHVLKLRHKAAEVIQSQIEQKGETPLLLCMLGDATDEEKYYYKALELSDNKSSRAYKALGLKAYYNKDYTKAVDMLERSIDCNRFQLDTLLRLGFAALEIEKWEVAAKAYRMYVNYETDNFDAWNNLAKAYINLNNKSRAFTIFQEAVKCDYDNWKIWDNILVTSVDCGHFEESVRAYHRILDIRESKTQNSFEGNTKMKELVDYEVLSALVKAVTNCEILDTFGNSAQQVHAPAVHKLFGRIAALSPKDEKFYELFAVLVTSGTVPKAGNNNENIQDFKENCFKAAQLMQKATAAFQTNNKRWEFDQCNQGISLFLKYGKYCIESGDSQQLISAKMSIKSVLSKVKKAQTSFETEEIHEKIQGTFHELEESLELILEEIKKTK